MERWQIRLCSPGTYLKVTTAATPSAYRSPAHPFFCHLLSHFRREVALSTTFPLVSRNFGAVSIPSFPRRLQLTWFGVFSLHSFRLWVPKQMHVPGPMTPSSSLKSQSALSFIFLLYTAACKDHTDSIVTFFGSNGDHSARRM